jgi:hypothetical protein
MPDLPTRGHGCCGTDAAGTAATAAWAHGRHSCRGAVAATGDRGPSRVRPLGLAAAGAHKMQRRDEEGPPWGAGGWEAPSGSRA